MPRAMHGTICATILPMKGSGSLDEPSLRRLCDHLADNGIHGIYPNGTNGEGVLLSREERRRVAEIALDQTAGRMTVHIQCTAISITETAEHIRHAMDIGADGVGVMTPFFFKYDDDALAGFFHVVLPDAAGFPVYLYNIPMLSGNDAGPTLFRRLCNEHPSIRGIKFTSTDLLRLQDYLLAVPETDVLVGCDSLYLSCLGLGGVGEVSGPAAVFCRRYRRLYDAVQAGDSGQAKAAQWAIIRSHRAMVGIPGIPAIKFMLKILGVIDHDGCRQPLRRLTDKEKFILSDEVARYVQEEG